MKVAPRPGPPRNVRVFGSSHLPTKVHEMALEGLEQDLEIVSAEVDNHGPSGRAAALGRPAEDLPQLTLRCVQLCPIGAG
jgi:hypothetical protein